MVRRRIANDNQVSVPFAEPQIHRRDETPALPFQFGPDIEDQKFYRLGEDPLEGCIRDAIKEAGRERWYEITSNGGWTDFLVQSRDLGLVGHDSNSDANEVNGLLHQVHTQAVADNPKLDSATNDTEKCASLVERFTTEQMLDEIILSWAYDHGHVGKLPPMKRQPERRHVITDLVLDNENHTKMEVVDGVIGYIPKRSHVPANTIVPGTSTVLANSTVPQNFTGLIDQSFPGNRTGPLEPTSTVDVGPFPIIYDPYLGLTKDPAYLEWFLNKESKPPANSTASNNSTHGLDSLFPGNSTRRFNSTSHGRLFARRSLNAASLVDEISSEVEKDITEGVRVASLIDPEILDIFGQDGDRLKGFLGQPVVRDLMYATTKKHHKHGKHGKKEGSVWADPKFVSKFIKDSVQGVKNSAQILDGVVRAVEHKTHSKHKDHSEA